MLVEVEREGVKLPGWVVAHPGQVDLQVLLKVACIAGRWDGPGHYFLECMRKAVLLHSLLICPLGIHLQQEEPAEQHAVVLVSGFGGICRVHCLVLLVGSLGGKGVIHWDTAAVVSAKGGPKPVPCAFSKTPAGAERTGCA